MSTADKRQTMRAASGSRQKWAAALSIDRHIGRDAIGADRAAAGRHRPDRGRRAAQQDGRTLERDIPRHRSAARGRGQLRAAQHRHRRLPPIGAGNGHGQGIAGRRYRPRRTAGQQHAADQQDDMNQAGLQGRDRGFHPGRHPRPGSGPPSSPRSPYYSINAAARHQKGKRVAADEGCAGWPLHARSGRAFACRIRVHMTFSCQPAT